MSFVKRCPIGMSLPADSSREGLVSLHFTQPGLSMPAAAGVVDEMESEYILAHTGPRELDGHPLGVCGSGFWFSSRLYYPFSKGQGQHTIWCLKNTKCGNEMTSAKTNDGKATGMLLAVWIPKQQNTKTHGTPLVVNGVRCWVCSKRKRRG